MTINVGSQIDEKPSPADEASQQAARAVTHIGIEVTQVGASLRWPATPASVLSSARQRLDQFRRDLSGVDFLLDKAIKRAREEGR